MIKRFSFLLLFMSILFFSCNNKMHRVNGNDKGVVSKPSFVKEIVEIINEDGLEKSMKWFRKNKDSNKYDFNENELNTLGYQLLYDLKSIENALKVFNLNASIFPNSANVYDSLGEAYLKSGEFISSINNYRKAALMVEVKSLYHFGFLQSEVYKPTKIPTDVKKLFVSEGDWEQDTAYVYLQGGPDYKLHINERDGLHLMDNGQNLLKIYPYQALMLNPNQIIAQPALTIEQSIFENAQSVEILDRTVLHLKEKGKKVIVIGHSYGASICLEYLNSKENLADKVVVMGMDLDEDISSWDNLRPGEYARWEDGLKPYAKKVFAWLPIDYPINESFYNITDNMEMIIRANMQKKYSSTLKPNALSKLISVYADEDEANGIKSQEEIDFLKKNNVLFVAVNGDHHSMLTKEFMQKLYNHLTKSTPL